MDDEIKRWTARRKSALVLEIIQGKTTVAEANRAHDLPPSEIEKWVDCRAAIRMTARQSR
jgi:transposase-like protein